MKVALAFVLEVANLLLCTATAIVGYRVNVAAESWCPLLWSFVDFFFWPIAWIKWMACNQVNVSFVQSTFSSLLN